MKKLLLTLSAVVLLSISSCAMANSHYTYVGIDLNNEGVYVGHTPWQYLSVEVGVAKVYIKSNDGTTDTEDNVDNNGNGFTIAGDSYSEFGEGAVNITNITNNYNNIGSNTNKGSYNHTPRASILLHTSMSKRLFFFGKYSYDRYDNYTSLGFGANLTKHLSSRMDYNLDDKSVGINLIWRF